MIRKNVDNHCLAFLPFHPIKNNPTSPPPIYKVRSLLDKPGTFNEYGMEDELQAGWQLGVFIGVSFFQLLGGQVDGLAQIGTVQVGAVESRAFELRSG